MELVVAGAVECPKQLPPNVTCIGYLNNQELLASAYASADVYVHLSREDTFGKVIAEALACGTPAVVYDSTACPEIVTPGTGYVVPVGDIEEILNCCRLIRENGKEAYTRLCRASAENRFDKEKLIAETLALYSEVTATKE